MVVTCSPRCKIRRGEVSLSAGITTKTQVLTRVLYIAMMHEAEEEEQNQ
jgi:hypothetical protein